MNTQQQYLKETEVAQLTSISVRTLQNNRWKKIGIPYSKLNRSIRYSIEDVKEYINSLKIKTN